MDGTLKQAESPYQYLHERLGVAHLAAEHRELALAGRISYGEWLRRDAVLWAGQPVAQIRRLLAENPFLPGAPELLRALKRAGVVGGVGQRRLHAQHRSRSWPSSGWTTALANELTSADGVLDGGSINHVPEGGKAAFACDLMARLGIPPEQTLAAGDTHGDLELFDCAGVRIAVAPQLARPPRPRRCRVRAGPDRRGVVAGRRGDTCRRSAPISGQRLPG